MKKLTLAFFIYAITLSASAQEAASTIGVIEFVSDELSGIIKKEAKVEILAEGFVFTEGPLWLEKQKALIFADVPANTIYKWSEAKGKEIYLKPAGYTGAEPRGGFMGPNGLALSADGKLLICQHGDRRVAKMDAPLDAPKPEFVTMAGKHISKKLNSPNDLMVASNGDIYFTDPSYGFERGDKDPKRELTFQGIYKTNKAGTTLLVDSIAQPNGIGIFPGGKKLLVSNSADRNNRWYIYDITSNGSLANGKVFYDVSTERRMGGCDGFKIDKMGNVFATGPGGVWIFNSTGKLIGKIKMNGVTAANCALTPDNKTLFITATKYLLRVKMR